MKKATLRYLFAALGLASMSFFSSCGSDDEDPISTDPGINTKTTVLLGNQNNTTDPSFYSVSEQTTYSSANFKTNISKIDIGFGTGTAAGNEYFVGAPSDESIKFVYSVAANNPSTRATTFKTTTLTKEQFDAIQTDAALVTAVNAGTATNPNSRVRATDTEKGDIFAFETIDSKKGLVYVEDRTGTNTGSAQIKITVKAQK
jgi:hypothetical protein